MSRRWEGEGRGISIRCEVAPLPRKTWTRRGREVIRGREGGRQVARRGIPVQPGLRSSSRSLWGTSGFSWERRGHNLPPRKPSRRASRDLIRSLAASSWAKIRSFTCSCSLPSPPPDRFSITCADSDQSAFEQGVPIHVEHLLGAILDPTLDSEFPHDALHLSHISACFSDIWNCVRSAR